MSDKSTPRVSVITPLYNAAVWIDGLYHSLRAQTLTAFEVILVDDASGDDTARRAQRLVDQDQRFRLLRLAHNAGPAAARNAGIEVARGRFLAFHDADDIWHPEKLSRQCSFMRERSVAWSYHDYRHMDTNGHRVGRVVPAPSTLSRWAHYTTRGIACSAVMLDRQALTNFAFPLLDRGIPEDFAAWTVLVEAGVSSAALHDDLLLYRVHEQQRSGAKTRAAGRALDLYRSLPSLRGPQKYLMWSVFALNAGLKHALARPSIPRSVLGKWCQPCVTDGGQTPAG